MIENTNRYSEKCLQCNGCISCGDEKCIFNSGGDYTVCSVERCSHCAEFLRKDRLFLNNVG